MLFGRSHFSHLEYGEDVVFHREFAEYGVFLRQIAYAVLGAFVHREMSYVHIVDEYLSAVGLHQPDYHVK